MLLEGERDADEAVEEPEERLTGGASEGWLAHAVVIEVVRAIDAERPEDAGDHLREAVELVDGGDEAEVHARKDKEPGDAVRRVGEGDDGELRGADRALPVGKLDVVRAAQHGPVTAQAEDGGEDERRASGEVRGLARDRLAQGRA